jgi:hypothetical protein
MSAAELNPEQLAAIVAAVQAAQAPAKRGRKATKEKTLAESSKVNDHSPMSDDDRAFLDQYDWQGNLEANLTRAREAFERLMVGGAHIEHEAAGEGTCEECGSDTPWRETWGKFRVCAGCASRRHVAAFKVAAELTA